MNNPLRLIDPDGETAILAADLPQYHDIVAAQTQLAQAEGILPKVWTWLKLAWHGSSLIPAVGYVETPSAAALLAKNVAAGKAAEAAFKAELTAKGIKYRSQVRIGRSVLDFVTKGGSIEVKGTDWAAKSYRTTGGLGSMLNRILQQVLKHRAASSIPEKIKFVNKPESRETVKLIEEFFKRADIVVKW